MDLAIATRRGRRTFAVLLAGFAFLLSAVMFGTPSAHAASSIDSVAAALKDKPVYVDPDASPSLSSAQVDSLVSQIKDMKSGVPVFVAVLPRNATFAQNTLLQQLRNKVGKNGVYAASLGTVFHAQDFSGSLRTGQADGLAQAAVAGGNGDLNAVVSSFVSSADSAIIADGKVKPKDSSKSKDGAGLLIGVLVLAVIAGGAYFAVSSRKKQRAKQRRDAELAGLKRAVDEDITAYGEVLDELDFSPTGPDATDDMRRDYSKAWTSTRPRRRQPRRPASPRT